MLRVFARLYRRLFARRMFYGAHIGMLHAACRGLGMLSSNPKENGEYWFLSKHGRNFRTMFDIGANVGEYAAQALQSCPLAKIYCFEPHPVSIDILRARFKNEPRVTIVGKALGAADGKAVLYDHLTSLSREHATIVPDVIESLHFDQSKSLAVDIVTLDHFVDALGLESIDFLKIDVEGAEMLVLQGAMRTITKYRPAAMQIEFNEMSLLSKWSIPDLTDLLVGYRLYRLLPKALVEITKSFSLENKIFAYQNIIAIADKNYAAKTREA